MSVDQLKAAGNAAYSEGKYTDAVKLYTQAIAASSDAMTKAVLLGNRASAYLALSQFADAQADSVQCLTLDPSNMKAHRRLGVAKLRLGDFHGACEHLETAHRAGIDAAELPNAKDAAATLDEVAALLGRYLKDGFYHESKSAEMWQDLNRRVELAVTLSSPQAVQPMIAKVKLLHILGHIDTAYGTTQRLLSHAPTVVEAHAMKGWILISLGHFDDALATFKLGLSVDPDSSCLVHGTKMCKLLIATKATANAAYSAGKFAEAITAYQTAQDQTVEATGRPIAVWYSNMAACQMQLRDAEGALKSCSAALQLHATNAKTLVRRAKCYQLLEDVDHAMKDVEAALALEPSNADADSLLRTLRAAAGIETLHHVEDIGEFNKLVSSAGSKLVVVDFYADWCGPCKQVAPIYEQMANQYTNVVFAKVEGDKQFEISSKFSVRAFPTFVLLKSGAVVARIEGADVQTLMQKIKEHM